jgi:hypothetical protein
VFSGQCRIGDTRDEKFLAKLSGGRGAVRLGLYVPNAGPLRPSYLLSTWAEVSLAKTEVRAEGYSRRGPYGVDAAVVKLVDDAKGRGSQRFEGFRREIDADFRLTRRRINGAG